MTRGTTPTLGFHIPYDPALVEGGFITIVQFGALRIEKSLEDEGVALEPGRIVVTLTQEETLRLSAAGECRIQLRLKLTGGRAVASHIMSVPVAEILKEGVI